MTPSPIRPARPSDADALSRLDHDTWSTLHAVMPRPLPPFDPFFDADHRPEDYLVADLGDGPVGYVRIGFATRLACNTHVRQVQGLVVAESARGRGLARGLLRAACDEARRRGATRITLRVLGHNKPARALYESEGFAVEGVLPGEFLLGGAYVDDVFMGRALTP
ncbi:MULTISPECIES: GNAT family N-acetyltransferase [Streptomyces]|uniref:Acetyltransferase n=2 Tax=Streptomyces TaxID=1883 RepID=A0A100Y0I8_9ACTN|nr:MULTISPECIES: GNAT family N-acetyltransferase [Streptomyces]KUH35461.1 acetyltransferase [Streptomyces kanasensis]UUS30702.1 GNAT family N-acetyltransferase [Streptomyces changanensis]